MPAAVIVRDSDGTVLGANRLATHWFGTMGGDVSSRKLGEILPFSFDQQMTPRGLCWLNRRDESGPTCVCFSIAEDPHDSSSSIVIFTEATEAALRAELISEVAILLESSHVRKTTAGVLTEVCLAVGRVMNLPLVEVVKLQGDDCIVVASEGESEVRSSVARATAAHGSALREEIVIAMLSGRRPMLRLVESCSDAAKRDLRGAGIAEVAVWPFAAAGQLGLKLYSRSQHQLSSSLVYLAMTSFVSWLGGEMQRVFAECEDHTALGETRTAVAAKKQAGTQTHVVVECRGKREDNELEGVNVE